MVKRTMRNDKRLDASVFKAWLVEQAHTTGLSQDGRDVTLT